MIQDDDRSGLIAGIDAPFVEVVNELKDRFGDYPDRQQLLLLREWYLNQSTGTGKFKEVQVVLKYSEPMQLTADETMQHVLAHELFPNVSGLVFGPGPEDLVRQPLTVRAVPLAAGTPIPGKDIAVLKISPDADDPVDPRDRLICLPLGDSDAVIPGSFPIQALGYPGAAFDPYLMNEGAGYRVNSQDGQIDQLREMQGGWNAFEMTALIYHGHSGGPVIDRHGNIVALNVGVAQENPNVEVFGRTLAVPINLVREFLRQAGIDALDPGPLVERWNDGLRAFAKGDYATAFSDFSIILYRQAAPFEPTPASNSGRTMLTPPKTARLLPTAAQASKPPPPVEKYLSPYVEDMWLRSLRLLLRALGGSSLGPAGSRTLQPPARGDAADCAAQGADREMEALMKKWKEAGRKGVRGGGLSRQLSATCGSPWSPWHRAHNLLRATIQLGRNRID